MSQRTPEKPQNPQEKIVYNNIDIRTRVLFVVSNSYGHVTV